jgi:large subunit ribosomal protein L32
MPVPAKRRPSSETRRRRSHHALKKIVLITCPKCKKSIKPHTVCKNCGYYKGVEVVKIKSALDKKKAKKKA